MHMALLAFPSISLAFKITLGFSFCSLALFFLSSSYSAIPDLGTPSPLTPPVPEHLIAKPSLPRFFSHGSSKCLPTVTEDLIQQAVERNVTCDLYAPFKRSKARIATVSVTYGKRKEHIDKALETHITHSIIHHNDMHVMCDPLVDALWNKPAFLLNIMLEQMLLPPEEKYEWLFWADRDTIILDQCRPASSFLPPEPEDIREDAHLIDLHPRQRKGRRDESGNATTTDEQAVETQIEKKKDSELEPKPEDAEEEPTNDRSINIIASKDHNGLNNGVFLLRVSQWSISVLENILAYQFYNPAEELQFTEQSAMERVLSHPAFSPNVAYVPHEWFNTYPNSDFGPKMYAERADEEGLQSFQARRGDFLVHFAGPWDKGEPMMEWWRTVRELGDVWESGRVQRDVSADVRRFWRERGF